MPIHEFLCSDCGHAFEDLVRPDERPDCPQCGSDRAEKQFSVFGVGGADPGPLPGPGGCGTCGDPRGPGACMN